MHRWHDESRSQPKPRRMGPGLRRDDAVERAAASWLKP